jgi:hypothetical protein
MRLRKPRRALTAAAMPGRLGIARMRDSRRAAARRDDQAFSGSGVRRFMSSAGTGRCDFGVACPFKDAAGFAAIGWSGLRA